MVVTSEDLTNVYNWVLGKVDESSVDDIMIERSYIKESMKRYLLENRLLRFEDISLNASEMLVLQQLGLLTGSRFTLEGRVVIPIKDARGNIIALVGWRKGATKYMTIASDEFSKEALWFNIDRALDKAFSDSSSVWYGTIVVVEGIFDALSLDMIGVPAIATMGANVGEFKGEMLKLFDRVLCIPDTDKVGLKAVQEWCVGDNAMFLYFKGSFTSWDGSSVKYKDIDQLCNNMDGMALQQVFLSILGLGVRNYTYELT